MAKNENAKKYATGSVWNKYGYIPPDDPRPKTKPVFDPSIDCFGYKEEKGCTVLTLTWCKYERCRFYKTEEQYQMGLIDSMRIK